MTTNPKNWTARNEHPEFAYSEWQMEAHAGRAQGTYHEWVQQQTEAALPAPDAPAIRPAAIRRATKADMIDGATYPLGSVDGRYSAKDDNFRCGNFWISRSETIYGDQADPLYLGDIRAAAIERAKAAAPEPSADELVAQQAGDAAIFGQPQSFEEQHGRPALRTWQHPYRASDLNAFDPDCAVCGGKGRDSQHGDTDEIREACRIRPTLFEQAHADEKAGNFHAAAEGYRLLGNDHREAGRMADAESLYACARRCLEAADPAYKARRARLLKRLTSMPT